MFFAIVDPGSVVAAGLIGHSGGRLVGKLEWGS